MISSRALILAVGGVVALAYASLVTEERLAAQVRTEAKACNVPRAVGDLRFAWQQWLIFEDSQGRITAVDERCEVHRVIRRE
jgi:hypothetical protein